MDGKMMLFFLISQLNVSLSIEFLLIFCLFIYIIFLHIQLSKKNFYIKSYLQKQGITEDNYEKKDISRLLERLRNPEYKGTMTKDKMLDREFSQFLFEDYNSVKLFLHYTSKKSIADKIIHEGFKFANSFYKTAVSIYNDELFLIHRHHEHKQYGNYVIVISISKALYNQYAKALSKTNAKNIAVEQILTEHEPLTDENADDLYIFPKQFIKGYFNYIEGTIVKNPDFDFNYSSPQFEENLKKLRSSGQ